MQRPVDPDDQDQDDPVELLSNNDQDQPSSPPRLYLSNLPNHINNHSIYIAPALAPPAGPARRILSLPLALPRLGRRRSGSTSASALERLVDRVKVENNNKSGGSREGGRGEKELPPIPNEDDDKVEVENETGSGSGLGKGVGGEVGGRGSGEGLRGLKLPLGREQGRERQRQREGHDTQDRDQRPAHPQPSRIPAELGGKEEPQHPRFFGTDLGIIDRQLEDLRDLRAGSGLTTTISTTTDEVVRPPLTGTAATTAGAVVPGRGTSSIVTSSLHPTSTSTSTPRPTPKKRKFAGSSLPLPYDDDDGYDEEHDLASTPTAKRKRPLPSIAAASSYDPKDPDHDDHDAEDLEEASPHDNTRTRPRSGRRNGIYLPSPSIWETHAEQDLADRTARVRQDLAERKAVAERELAGLVALRAVQRAREERGWEIERARERRRVWGRVGGRGGEEGTDGTEGGSTI